MAKSISTSTTKTKKADSLKTKSEKAKSPLARPAARPTGTEDRESMIRYAAYFLAESDGFQDGRESEYWIQAEKQIDQLLKARPSVSLEDKH